MSFDVILPFLRPIERLIKDPTISEIMVNGPACVFIERDGQVELVPGVSIAEKSLQVAVRNIARALGGDRPPAGVRAGRCRRLRPRRAFSSFRRRRRRATAATVNRCAVRRGFGHRTFHRADVGHRS